MGQILSMPGLSDAGTVRHTLREANTPALLLRRAIIGVSMIGMASMAVIALFQGGLIRHLPDPPIKGFDSDRVNTFTIWESKKAIEQLLRPSRAPSRPGRPAG